MNEKQQIYVDKAPESVKGILERAFLGKSKATAIKAKCLSCCNWQRSEITACAVFICPLHPFRPFQSKDAKG